MNQLYTEYDEIMIGKRENFSGRFFSKENTKSMENAVRILRYSFSKYLRWPPEVLSKRIDRALLEKLHLYQLMKFIQFPVEYDREKDLFYLVTLAYDKYGLKDRDKTIHTYEKVLDGSSCKYPKDYFTGSDGVARAGICLQYMINHFIIFRSINELYGIFATDEGYSYLQKYKLINVCKEVFDTPVDFLHFALPPQQKNQLYFHYYKFKYYREMVNENGRKCRSTHDYILKGALQ